MCQGKRNGPSRRLSLSLSLSPISFMLYSHPLYHPSFPCSYIFLFSFHTMSGENWRQQWVVTFVVFLYYCCYYTFPSCVGVLLYRCERPCVHVYVCVCTSMFSCMCSCVRENRLLRVVFFCVRVSVKVFVLMCVCVCVYR